MPDNMNPYMDSGMNPNGFVPNYGQPGYVDETNPYAQQMGWDQSQFGMPQAAYPGAAQPPLDDFFNPGNMASPQDIYANQAAQMGGMPGQYGAPYPDAFGGMGGQPYVDPYADPYAQPGFPAGQPMYDPMQQMPGPGQTGQQAPVVPGPGQTGQQAPVSPGQTGGFDNPMQAAQMPSDAQGQQMAGGMPPQQTADAQQAVHLQQMQAAQQQIKQQAAQQAQQQQQQQQQQSQQQPQQAKQDSSKKPKRQQSQVQPMPVVGSPVIDPSKATKGRARLALILGILSIIFALIPPIGLILAIIARKTAKSYKRNGGRAGAGDAGAVFGLVGIIFSIATFGLLIWFIGYVNGAIIGSKAYMNPISFFNNSPLGALFKIPTS